MFSDTLHHLIKHKEFILRIFFHFTPDNSRDIRKAPKTAVKIELIFLFQVLVALSNCSSHFEVIFAIEFRNLDLVKVLEIK